MPPAAWIRVRVAGAAEPTRDAIAAALVAAGASALVQPDADVLETYLAAGSDLRAVRAAVAAAGAGATLVVERVGHVPPPVSWTGNVTVQRLGRITVAPPWLAGDLEDPEGAVVIDPGTAFGTGDHATTRGMLRLMQGVIRPGDAVADLGAGSGVLSIAAVRLGAASVVAIESDEDSIGNAEANVARNGVADRVTVLVGDAAVMLPLVAPVRVVLANIISSVLIRLAPVIHAALAPDGRVVMGGIWTGERDQLLAGVGGDRWLVEAEDTEMDWWSVALAPR